MLAGQTKSGAVLLGTLAIAGCSVACGCENNPPALRAWADCAEARIAANGQAEFARQYIGRSDSVSQSDKARWTALIVDTETKCGSFKAAYSRGKLEEASHDNVVVLNDPAKVLSVNGMRDEPKSNAASSVERH